MDEEADVFEPEKKSIELCKCLIDGPSSEEIVIPARKQKILTAAARTESYLRERRIPELIRFIFTKVVTDAPNRPMVYLEKLLDDCMFFRAGIGLPPVIYENRHLQAVIKSFDPGQRGWLSCGQVRRAFTTLGLSPPAFLQERMPCDVVFNLLRNTQEAELFNLLSAGMNKSPIVKNVVPYTPLHNAVADRLVLFMVDGLRAESFLNYTTMPFLRSIANSHGRWGISHTRMPTESRPGHVAVIAGFYEDPSAIVKGWKENPVDFDSVFNQSLYTWCWGTYDIIEIFTKGAVTNHIFSKKMDPYDQTFSSDKNTTHLDAWVFDNVENFFQNAKNDHHLYEKLKQRKIIFFLHLLGTDTSGHTHKPKSPNFLSTVKFVDDGISRIEKIIREFYNNDNKTTFLMTSDHGMTDWGSHGAGLEHETQTPYVLWGAGVKQTKQVQIDPQTNQMSFEHRLDINQADLSPLMATILSIPVPVNSVGQIPVDLLNLTLSDKAKAVYSNGRQLASQYNTKRLDVEKNILPIFHKPFEPFSGQKYQEIIEFTEKMLVDGIKDNEQYEKLILFSKEIMNLSMAGLNYYHNYYQKPLLVLVTLSFVGWIVCLLKFLLIQNINTQTETSNLHKYGVITVNKPVILLLFMTMSYLIYVQNLPVQYYLYVYMPVLLWIYALSPLDVWSKLFKDFVKRRLCGKVAEIVCYVLGSLALGMSFTHRWMLSIPLLGMGLWPFFLSTRSKFTKSMRYMWPVGCILLSIFSFTPVVGKSTYIELVIIAGVIWLIILLMYIYKIILPVHGTYKRDLILTVVQLVLLILALQNIYVQSIRFDRGSPVSYTYQTLAWVISATSLVLPVAFSKRLICRLMAVNTSLIIFYLLLSVCHEGLFMVALIMNVTCWLLIEFRFLEIKKLKIMDLAFEETDERTTHIISIERSISKEDFRRSFIFIFYIILAFFGTGNIASLNSFEVRWVTCFITSFKPFIITVLIMLKTLAPFMVVACSFRGIQILTKAPTGYLNIIVLIYSNIMGIQLLYNVKNTGSWLDIGTSISQFVIVQLVTLFIVLISQIAKVLTDISIYNVANMILGKSIKKYV
ncbi:GPI ethanolamine phosphate transferase 1 [Amyelois transitella]|uniref:GPI ethanolamine phosphate transferase 1 n=1 Tax=Amyelois transitella TaxID=680683 RepID=UPI00298FFEA4|nr:GPI ethanolamine phosphate transferase 1 [Amyelois transitella]